MTLYQRFKTTARLCEETDFVKVYRVAAEDTEYKVVVTKKRANRYTVVHCENNRIFWEQVPLFPRFAGRNYGDKVPIFTAVPEKNYITLFVVKGRPNGFVGLDEGVFRCVDNFDVNSINVMSWRRFRNG